ncbi:hypothetical protein CRG98_020319 [Punica granatum]|uniref:Uncharacterized protein n=1 Tax=Punica granatum TaxID=22663 RepID=A0A2I0JTR5_PUNGR|nr:hypothetical protein CRG98_020319 [Punica granatum]
MGQSNMGLHNGNARRSPYVVAEQSKKITALCFLPAEIAPRNCPSNSFGSIARSSGSHEVDSKWPDGARFVRNSRKMVGLEA